MIDLLSPKQVAQALRVSESSVKRWCDKGSIATTYTEGGHRRIRLSDLAGFVRERSLTILDFGPIGFQSDYQEINSLEAAQKLFCEYLLAGDERKCAQIVLQLFFEKKPLSHICDQVIARTFHEVGELWACGEAEIYQERRGCRIAHRILGRMIGAVPEPPASNPTAIGCTAEGDNYSLGSTMAELILSEVGWQAHALGENLPLTSLSSAISKHSPQLVWMSCSHINDVQRFAENFGTIHEAHHQQVAFVVGGRAINESLVAQLPRVQYCRSMTELHEFASVQLRDVQSLNH